MLDWLNSFAWGRRHWLSFQLGVSSEKHSECTKHNIDKEKRETGALLIQWSKGILCGFSHYANLSLSQARIFGSRDINCNFK